MSREISEITRDITLQNDQLDADRRGLAHAESEIAQVANAEQAITDWRCQMSRLGRPSVMVPKHLLEDQRSLQAYTQTREALMESISAREAKLGLLEAELKEAKEAALDESWQVISAEADRLAQILLEQQKAYTDTARQMFALNALARPGKPEWFKGETQQIFAPPLPKQLKTPRQQAECLDQFGYQALIKPVVDEAQTWRAALVEDKSAPSPFAKDKNVAA